jgi:hypothetical protein
VAYIDTRVRQLSNGEWVAEVLEEFGFWFFKSRTWLGVSQYSGHPFPPGSQVYKHAVHRTKEGALNTLSSYFGV